jgi:predicted peptidase
MANQSFIYKNYPFTFKASLSLEKKPLIIFFHGAGEVGNDGLKPIEANASFDLCVKHPLDAHVLVGQFPYRYDNDFDASQRNDLMDYIDAHESLIEKLSTDHKIDQSKVYALSLSMGSGIATLYHLRYPKRFASSLMIAKRRVKDEDQDLSVLLNTKLTLAHGLDDPINPYSNSFDLYEKLKDLGHQKLKLMSYSKDEFEKRGISLHNAWDIVYEEDFIEKYLKT